jgi:hypothetical protein
VRSRSVKYGGWALQGLDILATAVENVTAKVMEFAVKNEVDSSVRYGSASLCTALPIYLWTVI